MFTGDRSGDWLYRAMHRAGFANRPESVSKGDGLLLTDAWVTAPVRCAPPGNKPSAEERDRCRPWLEEELDRLDRIRVVVCLGGFAWATMLRVYRDRGLDAPALRSRFGHGIRVDTPGPVLLSSYHPSQQNTFTGRLTEAMFDSVFSAAATIIAGLG